MATKRLYRSRQERMLGGVCGGIAEYFDWDVSLVRFVLLMFVPAAGSGFLAYIVAWIVIPENPETITTTKAATKDGKTHEVIAEEIRTTFTSEGSNSQKLIGMALIALGAYFFLQQFFSWLRLDTLWPLLIVVVGIGFILKRD